ncbi:MAG: hypothetical protein LBL20_05965 [Treponema sp.]|jgi:hypothetical protein|nr:hypothetical protein [Treponema sp.]
MGNKEKSEIQKAVDLLEGNGYHVFKIEEELVDRGIASGRPTGAIQIWIAPKEEEG